MMKKILLILAVILMAVQFAVAKDAASKEMQAKYEQMILVKNYDGALALLEDFFVKNPNDVKNASLLACMYLYKNLPEKAAPLIEASLNATRDTPTDYLMSLYIFDREDEAWKLAEERDWTEDLKKSLEFIVGEAPTPAKFRLVILGIEKSAFQKQMNNMTAK